VGFKDSPEICIPQVILISVFFKSSDPFVSHQILYLGFDTAVTQISLDTADTQSLHQVILYGKGSKSHLVEFVQLFFSKKGENSFSDLVLIYLLITTFS